MALQYSGERSKLFVLCHILSIVLRWWMKSQYLNVWKLPNPFRRSTVFWRYVIYHFETWMRFNINWWIGSKYKAATVCDIVHSLMWNSGLHWSNGGQSLETWKTFRPQRYLPLPTAWESSRFPLSAPSPTTPISLSRACSFLYSRACHAAERIPIWLGLGARIALARDAVAFPGWCSAVSWR